MPRSAEVLSESLLEGQLLPFWEGSPLGITSEPFSRHQGFSRLRSKLNAPRQRRDPRIGGLPMGVPAADESA